MNIKTKKAYLGFWWNLGETFPLGQLKARSIQLLAYSDIQNRQSAKLVK